MSSRLSLVLGALTVLLLAIIAVFAYRYASLSSRHEELRTAKTEADAYVATLRAELTAAKSEGERLATELYAERARNGSFEAQISEISGTVGTLTKLATTDPELLAKYSKVYFLNENYHPSELSLIDRSHLADPERSLEIHSRVKPHLEELIDDAKSDGIELRIVSAYRSFGAQASLKNGYLVSYGSGANRFSADQGYSEHQLGTTIDFTTEELGTAFTSFGTTKAYPWLLGNAYRYGFILSYPKGNAHYIHEPWHWRYVGIALATFLKDEGKDFYELDQREINTYLVNLFD